jgi:tetratricopeptide (TPR) repeat protein
MKTVLALFFTIIISLASATGVQAQDNKSDAGNFERANKLFTEANELMEQRKHAEALARYQEVITLLPDESSVLFNGALAAYLSRDYALAADWWKKLKAGDPQDWHARAKLIQAYHALGKLAERDAERAELFALRKSGKNEELNKQFEYCREQFEVNGLKVMAFEHFELKGERALRYVFSVLNEKGEGEEFRISLGSYEVTNSVWRATTKPKPKDGERLFHLDGYYRWGHATYGMYDKEPTYDEIRAQVVSILEKKRSPASFSVINPDAKKPEDKQKP